MSYQLPSAFLQKFTPKEIHELKRVFKEHDHDYAAAIARSDLATVLLKLGENVTPNQAATLLQQVSLAQPTTISFHEFLDLLYDFRTGAIALDASVLMGHAAIASPTTTTAAPVAPTPAPTTQTVPAVTTPFFAKQPSWNANATPVEQTPVAATSATFASKSQWPPTGASSSSTSAQPPAPPAHKSKRPPTAGSAPAAAPSEPLKPAASHHWTPPPRTTPPKETVAAAATSSKPQWPPTGASPVKDTSTKPQWPPAGASSSSPAKDATSSKPQWPPTGASPAKDASAKPQWPPAAGQATASPPKAPQWPPNHQQQQQPAADGTNATTRSPAKPKQWPPAAATTTTPPTSASAAAPPSRSPPRSPDRPSPSRSPARPTDVSSAFDAHTIGTPQRRATAMYNANATIHEVKGASGGGVHSYSEEETAAFTEHINNCLLTDKDVAALLPLNPVDGLFRSVSDGILLCKLINAAAPETIDVRAINMAKRTNSNANAKALNVYEKTENHNLSINAAKSIGCSVVNIGPSDLIEGKPILVLGLVWQIIKIQLTSSINLKNHPELMRLLLDGESLEAFMKLPPDQILLRWMNYHLKAAGYSKIVKNFSTDVQDASAYSVLLHHIAPETCDLCDEDDADDRAAHVIANARRLAVETFIQPRDITSGNPKLNMSFVAQLFNTCPALDVVAEELKQLEEILYDGDVGDTREERVFRLWINSLAIDGVYVNHLFSDLRDGLYLLKVLDKIEHGIVSWSKVNVIAPNKFKQVENCNYCVDVGKQLHFSLVNIGGIDIFEGAKKLLLSIIWQAMRFQQLKLLSGLAHSNPNGSGSGGADAITDKDILDWANAKVRASGHLQHQIVAFRDPVLSDARFLLDLVHAIEPRAVNWDQVSTGASDEDKAANAKYAISCAQKIGVAVFLTYEDIVEVKPKMMMTFVASLMSLDMHNQQ